MKNPTRWRLSRRLLAGFILLASVPLLVVGLGIRQYTRGLLDESFEQRADLTRRVVEGWREQLMRQTRDAASEAVSDVELTALLSADPFDRARALDILSRIRDETGVDGLDLYEVHGGGKLLMARTGEPTHAGFPVQVTNDLSGSGSWNAPELGVALFGSTRRFEEASRLGVAAYHRLDGNLLGQIGEGGSFVLGTVDVDGRPLLSGGLALDAWPDSVVDLAEVPVGGVDYALGRVDPFWFGLSLRDRSSALGRLDLFLLMAIFLAVVVAIVAAWRVAVSAARPVEELAATVGQWGRGGDMGPLVTFAEGEAATLVDAFEHLRQELLAAEKRVSETARAAGWQEMARKVAHEIKNPLTPIRVTVEDLARRAASDPESASKMIPEAARLVTEEVMVLNRIVDAFSKFARLPEPQPVPVDLVAVAEDVSGMYASGTNVRCTSPDGPARVKADPLLLKEAMANIVKNAVEAAGPAGQVIVVVNAGSGLGSIVVTDTGPGFPTAFFEGGPRPYFTTKSDGTGLGLVVAQRIISDMGGDLELSNASTGAQAVIRFSLLK
jgi:signal transduction histidine kinase